MDFQVNRTNAAPQAPPSSAGKSLPLPAAQALQELLPRLTTDQVNTQKLPSGQSLNHINLESPAAPAVQARLEKLGKMLENRQDKALSLPQKETVLELLQDSRKDGSLPELIKQLDQKQQLLPLYKKMGSLVNHSPEASALLGLVTLGLSWGEEAKHNRAFEMKKILTEAGIAPEILKKLSD